MKKWTKAIVDDVKKDWKWYLCFVAVGVIIGWAVDPLWKALLTIILINVPMHFVVNITEKRCDEKYKKLHLIWQNPSD